MRKGKSQKAKGKREGPTIRHLHFAFFLFTFTFALACLGLSIYIHLKSRPERWPYPAFSGQFDPDAGLADPNNFSFALIGDCRGHTEAIEKIIPHAAGRAAFGFLLGDIVLLGEERQMNFFIDELGETLAATKRFPLYPVIGNHDLDRNQSSATYAALFGPTHYYLHAGKVLFVAINNVELDRFEAELLWLDQTLREQGPAADLILILLHRYPWAAGLDPKGHKPLPQAQTRKLFAVLKQRGVDAIFASHYHGYLEYRVEGIPVYVTGEAGAEQVSDPPNFGYLTVTVSDGKTFTVKHEGLGDIARWDRLEYFFFVSSVGWWPWLALFFALVLGVDHALVRRRAAA